MSTKIKVVVKTFAVLEALSKGRSLTLKELTKLVSFPKPTVFRLLYTLQALGYVEQEPASQTYALSSKFLSFVRTAGSGNDLASAAKPKMEKLLNEFKETVNLAKLVNNHVVYINILASSQAFRISDNVGDRASFHSTAIGKSILAFLPSHKQNEILKNYRFTRFSKKTIMNPAGLKQEIRRIKKAGFAVDNEEGHDGVVCVGAPILNNENQSFAAMSISMPKVRAKKITLDKIKKELPRICEQISLSMASYL